MNKQVLLGVGIAIIGFATFTTFAIHKPSTTPAQAIAVPQTEKATGIGMTAQIQAAKEKKYLFVFVYEKDDSKTQGVRKTFEAEVKKLDANWCAINKTASDEQDFIRKHRLTAPRTPFVIAIAPNGALTGGFRDVSEARMRKAMVSPGMQNCLKAMQERKMVILCIQNQATKLNNEALKGVKEFKEDALYASSSEIVMLDPADPGEQTFLTGMKITSIPQEALTILLTPPGSIIATFKGETNKKDFTDALQQASSNKPGTDVRQ